VGETLVRNKLQEIKMLLRLSASGATEDDHQNKIDIVHT
jgi:hypothetical protein